MSPDQLKEWLGGEDSAGAGWSKDDGSGETIGHERSVLAHHMLSRGEPEKGFNIDLVVAVVRLSKFWRRIRRRTPASTRKRISPTCVRL